MEKQIFAISSFLLIGYKPYSVKNELARLHMFSLSFYAWCCDGAIDSGFPADFQYVQGTKNAFGVNQRLNNEACSFLWACKGPNQS